MRIRYEYDYKTRDEFRMEFLPPPLYAGTSIRFNVPDKQEKKRFSSRFGVFYCVYKWYVVNCLINNVTYDIDAL